LPSARAPSWSSTRTVLTGSPSRTLSPASTPGRAVSSPALSCQSSLASIARSVLRIRILIPPRRKIWETPLAP